MKHYGKRPIRYKGARIPLEDKDCEPVTVFWPMIIVPLTVIIIVPLLLWYYGILI